MTVCVALADLAVASMNEHLGSFALSGLFCCVDGIGLVAMVGRIALRPFPTHGPVAVSGYDVNVCFHSIYPQIFLPGT
jgi:hypothetical protein